MIKLKNEEKYAKIIASGLMHFYFSKSVQNIRIDVSVEKEYITVSSSGKVVLSTKDLNELEILKRPLRLPEFEDYYDTLVGIGDSSNEISNIDTLSSMVDEAVVDYSEENLCISLKRKI